MNKYIFRHRYMIIITFLLIIIAGLTYSMIYWANFKKDVVKDDKVVTTQKSNTSKVDEKKIQEEKYFKLVVACNIELFENDGYSSKCDEAIKIRDTYGPFETTKQKAISNANEILVSRYPRIDFNADMTCLENFKVKKLFFDMVSIYANQYYQNTNKSKEIIISLCEKFKIYKRNIYDQEAMDYAYKNELLFATPWVFGGWAVDPPRPKIIEFPNKESLIKYVNDTRVNSPMEYDAKIDSTNSMNYKYYDKYLFYSTDWYEDPRYINLYRRFSNGEISDIDQLLKNK